MAQCLRRATSSTPSIFLSSISPRRSALRLSRSIITPLTRYYTSPPSSSPSSFQKSPPQSSSQQSQIIPSLSSKSYLASKLCAEASEILTIAHPQPVRPEFIRSSPITTQELESLKVGLGKHREPENWKDKAALTVVKILRKPTDWFFKKKYIHRAVMLETVAAVPGMVGGVLRHLKSLRLGRHDGGWIYSLLHEAENERMHLMTFMKLSQPTIWERSLVTLVQGVFFNAFFLIYFISPNIAHRVVGYLEEEAVISYTSFINEIDSGRIKNIPAPEIAIEYWNLEPTATLRDVVLAIRADEAAHRDTNHHFADRIKYKIEDLRTNHHVEKDGWRWKVSEKN